MADKRTQEIDLGIVRFESGDSTRPQRAVLTIETDKALRGGIDSDGRVMWHGHKSRVHMFGLTGNGGDFATMRRRNPTARATQKAIDRQHAEVFTPEMVAQLTADAKAYYAGVVEAGIDGFKNTYRQAEAVRAGK